MPLTDPTDLSLDLTPERVLAAVEAAGDEAYWGQTEDLEQQVRLVRAVAQGTEPEPSPEELLSNKDYFLGL